MVGRVFYGCGKPPQSAPKVGSPEPSTTGIPSTPHSALVTPQFNEPPARRLTGKVAKLPLEIRRIINEMLDEAETYKSIVARLNDLGYPGFFEQNIQRWKDHGYQRWVQFHEKLEIAKLQAEEAEELARDPKNIVNMIQSNQMKQAMDTSRLWDKVSEWDIETTLKNGRFYNQLSRSTTQQLAEQIGGGLGKPLGQGEGGIPVSSVSSAKSVVAPSAPVSDPASVTSVVENSETPNVKNTVENSNDSKAENENNTVENSEPQTNSNPEPGTSAGTSVPVRKDPILESAAAGTSNPEPVLRRPPADKIYRDPFPISPLAPTPPARKQPRNHVPLLDIHGQLIQWIPRDQEPTFETRIGWENRRGLSTCWMNPTHLVPEPPVHHNVPIVSREGIILAWVPHNIEPFEKAEPIRSRFNLQRKIGWWEQAPEKSEPDPRAGCLVG